MHYSYIRVVQSEIFIMLILEIQLQPWDKVYEFLAEAEESHFGSESVKLGDFVVIRSDSGMDIGKVIGEQEVTEEQKNEKTAGLKPIVRKATAQDLSKREDKNKNKQEKINYAHQVIKKFDLPMKLVDAYIAFDDSRITFAFIADERVDFREAVKDLTRHFGKSIHLRQLGVRDEAQITGDSGSCGRKLCCKSFLGQLESITSDFVEHQQLSHRGSDRLAGVCGRLKCCLSYEEKTYQALIANLPPIGSKVKTPEGEGVVAGWHTLEQIIDVRLQDKGQEGKNDGTIIAKFNISEIKKV